MTTTGLELNSAAYLSNQPGPPHIALSLSKISLDFLSRKALICSGLCAVRSSILVYSN